MPRLQNTLKVRLVTGVTLALLLMAPGALAQSRGSTPAHVENLQAEATPDGNLLTWDHSFEPERRNMFPNVEDPAEFRVYRETAEGDWELIASLNARTTEEYLDTDVEAGVTYRYAVLYYDGLESCGDGPGACQEDIVEVTAIPFFGAPILGAIAALGAVGAYATARRKRA